MSFSGRMKTIVVATDLEGTSEAALEYARKLAGAYQARIVLAHGLDPLEYAAVESVPGGILRRMPEQARAVLDGMAAGLIREGIHSHSELRQGAVVDLLLDVARQYDAGLIVIGTSGSQGAGPVAVGAIAEQLVRRSACPVLAVAADWNAGENRPVPGGPVMLALDRNDASESALEAALSLAATFKRTLIAVHARGSADTAASATAAEFGIIETDEFPVRFVVNDGPPAEVIRNAVLRNGPSILVAGVKRKSSSLGPHGTIFALLAGSRAPVLCVPGPAVAEEHQQTELAAQMG